MRRKIEYKGNEYYVEYTDTNIKILDSYKVADEKDMLMILSIISIYPQYKLTRKRKDLLDEWKAHNLAYKLHFMRKHTRDTDLNENEGKMRLYLYKMLGKVL